ncbi:MAG: PAS domain-containing protein, partial [Actinomycetota bacterium]
MESHSARDDQAALPRRREPDLAGFATFAVDAQGMLTAWSVTAAQLFGQQAHTVIGHDVCDVLLTGPGQRQLVSHALAEVAAGRVWFSTVAGGSLGEGRFAIRCEPAAGPGSGALVIAQRAWPQPGPAWLSEAAARIGRTLDLLETAAEVADVAVPGFADVTVLYGSERLLVGDELTSPGGDNGVVVRRLASRLDGYPVADISRLLPAG